MSYSTNTYMRLLYVINKNYLSKPERDQGVHFFIKHKSIVV